MNFKKEETSKLLEKLNVKLGSEDKVNGLAKNSYHSVDVNAILPNQGYLSQ